MSQYPPGPGQVPNYASPPPQSPVSGLAVAAMVVGIVAIFPGCCLSYYGLIGLGIVAIVFGVLARNQISAGRGRGAGMALAGIILGSVGALLGISLIMIVMFGGPALQDWARQMQHRVQQQQQQQQKNQQSATIDLHSTSQDTAPWHIEMQ
jgi:predicted metalloprotease